MLSTFYGFHGSIAKLVVDEFSSADIAGLILRAHIAQRASMLIATLAFDVTIFISALTRTRTIPSNKSWDHRRSTLHRLLHSVGAALLTPTTGGVAFAPLTEPTNAWLEAVMLIA